MHFADYFTRKMIALCVHVNFLSPQHIFHIHKLNENGFIKKRFPCKQKIFDVSLITFYNVTYNLLYSSHVIKNKISMNDKTCKTMNV